MSAAGREFMRLRMYKDDYDNLPPEYREQMEITRIEVEGYDYTGDPEWVKLNEKGKKEKSYFEKKKREFEIRHNNK